ncbi:hypothetical protein JW911_04050 [Candidatus Peregrinibacteria bacterium]|nr:hypothetical protein [Candidatus Peregrinibacteria bacterium]
MNKAVTDLKSHLKALIVASPSINSLPEEARKFRVEIMLASKPEDMQNFIEILEEERAAMQKIEEDFAAKGEEIQALVADAKALEAQANREIRKEKEEQLSVKEQETAASLLTKLDDIEKAEPQPKKKKGWFFNK